MIKESILIVTIRILLINLLFGWSSSILATEDRKFNASDFKWPTLIESLYSGTLEKKINTDESAFILYYIKSINEVFGDSDMKIFIGSECFTNIYDAEMDARLQSMFWLQIIPKAIKELGSVMTEKDKTLTEAMSTRYPMLTSAVQDITKKVPTGEYDRLFILANLPKILNTKAHQDALVLFTAYGCSSPVTIRIYSNAVAFVKAR